VHPSGEPVGELGVQRAGPVAHPWHGGLHDGSLPTGPGIRRVMGWARLVPMGALRQLRSSDGLNLYQLMVQHLHSIDGGRRWHIRELGHSGLTHLAASVGSHSLGLELGGGEVHH
jgi:hypothetical protein